jgi:hypothetical protein
MLLRSIRIMLRHQDPKSDWPKTKALMPHPAIAAIGP